MNATRASTDEQWMAAALRAACRGEGGTRPNPPVGAVVVRGGRAVASGHHARAGGPHAEVVALDRAGARARGATLYVTLEPCSTHGRTPPCTERIRASGLRRVVIGARDPNPRHRGRGARILRAAGIEVTEGIRRAECAALIEPFARWIATGRPWVTLKLALTLDGRIADARGASRWITGPAARRRVQALRRRADAVIVGVGTALADDPSLRARGRRGAPAWRVIVDSRGRLPLGAQVLGDGHAGETIVATTRCAPERWARAVAARGARVWCLATRGGRVSPAALLRRLGAEGVLHAVCEGGGALAGALVRAGLVDEYWIFLAPRLLGGDGVPGFAAPGWPLARAPRLRILGVERVGPDLLVRARPDAAGGKRGCL